MSEEKTRFVVVFDRGFDNLHRPLYKAGKLIFFETEETAKVVATALDGEVMSVVPFGDQWISEDHFNEIQHTDCMDIWSENEDEE